MNMWLVTIGEPVPVEEGVGDRLHRSGRFAHFLAEHGHQVTWWTSTFDHFRKKHWFDADTALRVNDGLNIRMLHGCGYHSNVSLARFRDHRQIARKFARLAAVEPAPDAILAALPPIELCVAAVRYGRARGVPVVLDMRDMWPDIFLDLAPRLLRPLARAALHPLFRDTHRACAGATAIIGVTEPFVDWGLKHGRRARSPVDRSFGFGYFKPTLEPSEIRAAETYWAEQGLNPDRGEFIVCFFGTLSRQFDIDTVIRAAKILKDSRCPARFVLCGSGDHLELYRNRAARCPNVLFPGWVDAAKIWTLMAMSALGLAPYRESPNFTLNITNKPIEYLAGGLPIALSHRHGLLYDLIEQRNCGFSYRGDPEELARGIALLQQHTDRHREMQANASALFGDQFVGEKVYGGLMEHLQRIVSRQSS